MEALKLHEYTSLFAVTSGSHAYGFPSEDSDHDIRGVHVLPIKDAISLEDNHPNETITKSVVNSQGILLDFASHDIRKFCKLILKKDGNCLENLFSPLLLQSQEELSELRDIVQRDCLTKHHSHHYLNFAKHQWYSFNVNGYKIKSLLYTYRVLLTGTYLMESGEICINLPVLAEHYSLGFIPELIEAKSKYETIELTNGLCLSVDYRGIHFRILEKFKASVKTTHLPEEPSTERLNDFLIKVRMKYG